ncbi:hypothetical protein BJ138DRAFT_1130350 [Hygrophoropsis aurantiaca]|uniref:Uncharacterized protein n=1 Tax=Hygrophoropsis aurantiaca TaxID=72124 RepID=A0ACB7ZYD9_9AGAM|nr:hypothetical protein BJ138DRAFT_1130350 [Hygrophoropsis aurantiaca]
MRLLNIVPNSAATIFSHFGIIHTKPRNRLSPEKVKPRLTPVDLTVSLLKTDIVATYGAHPSSNSRKLRFSELDDINNGLDVDEPHPPDNANITAHFDSIQDTEVAPEADSGVPSYVLLKLDMLESKAIPPR